MISCVISAVPRRPKSTSGIFKHFKHSLLHDHGDCSLTLLTFLWCMKSCRKSTTFFGNQSFSSQIDVFHDFIVVFSYFDFSPHDFRHEKGRSHIYIIVEWAKVSAWSTADANFGFLGTAEMKKLITNNSTIKTWLLLEFSSDFYDFGQCSTSQVAFDPNMVAIKRCS